MMAQIVKIIHLHEDLDTHIYIMELLAKMSY